MTRWSRMAFSAAFLDASIMKSERERPSMLAARSIRDCVSIRTRRLTAWSGVSEEAVVRGISLILCAALIIEDTQRVSGFQMREIGRGSCRESVCQYV